MLSFLAASLEVTLIVDRLSPAELSATSSTAVATTATATAMQVCPESSDRSAARSAEGENLSTDSGQNQDTTTLGDLSGPQLTGTQTTEVGLPGSQSQSSLNLSDSSNEAAVQNILLRLSSLTAVPLLIVALDCEMCYTDLGLELTRITLICPIRGVVLDELVRPEHPITDYNTAYSGITSEAMEGVTTTIADVHRYYYVVILCCAILCCYIVLPY